MFYLFYLGKYPIKTYWVIFGVAFLFGFFPFLLQAQKIGLSKKKIFFFYLGEVISVSLGARLFYLLLNQPQIIFKEPSKIFAFSQIYWQGGVSVYGGVWGGFLFLLFFSFKYKISFWRLADCVTLSLILGLTFMRLGCFFNGCCYGKPAYIPWAIVFNNPLVIAPKNIPLHPVQLYEAIPNFFSFFYFLKQKPKFLGEIILKYAIFYNLLRIIVEFFKHPSFHYKNTPFTFPQVLAFFFLIISLILYKIKYKWIEDIK
ncbi:MAG: prolipoprotein diacylglyceryl transferase [Candidatus Omnitrophica bacterium]|nr:prolipoprotein diacylglyceryl transferase [Candidatus Omnitrophota bacterium]MCM8793845.1 prolipoprotein diacylglyceryl transferase [Candidatus Omnitrophota bacterium]